MNYLSSYEKLLTQEEKQKLFSSKAYKNADNIQKEEFILSLHLRKILF